MTLLPFIFALAHGGERVPHSPHELWHTWGFDDPAVVISLALSAVLYIRGIVRIRAAAVRGPGVRGWEIGSFAAGWVALFVALVSPVHPWGRALFSVHMTQHEILMLIAAPLLVLGRPLVVFLHALPRRWASAAARACGRPAWLRIWRFVSGPFVAFSLHAVVLWIWHLPSWFEATLDNDWIHALQHSSFLGTALLFWWSLTQGRRTMAGLGLGVLYLFTTAMHSGLLGALLTFAGRTWYPAYAQTAPAWGFTPLQDQQLGGLIMWIPAGLVYVAAALLLFAAWLRRSEAQVARMESSLGRVVVLLLAIAMLAGCEREQASGAEAATGGDAKRGRSSIQKYGCISCHTVPGIAGANALVGPPLDHMSQRTYIGGRLTNTSDNMVRWLKNPHDIDDKSAMPNLYLSDRDARDIAAFLYTLK